MEALQSSLYSMVVSLVYLMIIIFVVMGITAVILRLFKHIIPIHKEITNFVLSLSALGATYVWFQLTFM